jgi:hypothetical protein
MERLRKLLGRRTREFSRTGGPRLHAGLLTRAFESVVHVVLVGWPYVESGGGDDSRRRQPKSAAPRQFQRCRLTLWQRHLADVRADRSSSVAGLRAVQPPRSERNNRGSIDAGMQAQKTTQPSQRPRIVRVEREGTQPVGIAKVQASQRRSMQMRVRP